MTAPRDNNRIAVIQGVLDTDGATLVNIKTDPTTHALKVGQGSSGTDNGPTDAARDGNYETTLVAVSESDGTTPVVLYADSSGNLLVDSN